MTMYLINLHVDFQKESTEDVDFQKVITKDADVQKESTVHVVFKIQRC